MIGDSLCPSRTHSLSNEYIALGARQDYAPTTPHLPLRSCPSIDLLIGRASPIRAGLRADTRYDATKNREAKQVKQ